MVALTLYLGVWQVQRLAWKTALLAQIDRGEAAAPVPLSEAPAPFSKVVVMGRLRPESALYGVDVRATPAGLEMGAQLVRALDRDGAAPVIVVLGWIPESVTLPVPEGSVEVVGYVRPPELPVRFGAGDDPAARRFFALDPVAIGRALGLASVAPFTVVALGPSHAGVYPQPADALPRPVNNHLSYAVTWFGMAGVGVVIFAVYARKVLRP